MVRLTVSGCVRPLSSLEVAGASEQAPTTLNHRQVRHAKVLSGPIVDTAHTLLDGAVLLTHAIDARVRAAQALLLAIDAVVVLLVPHGDELLVHFHVDPEEGLALTEHLLGQRPIRIPGDGEGISRLIVDWDGGSEVHALVQ